MVRTCLACALFIAIVGPGCTTVDGDNILTSGIYASIHATAEGTGQTRVVATLYLESPSSLNFIELGEGDELWAYGPGGQDQELRKTQLFGLTSYSANFDEGAEGDEFIVALLRDVDTGAPDSQLTLPAPFEFETEGNVSASRAEDLEIEYSPAGSADDATWQLSGTCIQEASGEIVDDTGTLTIAAGLVQQTEAEDVEDTCEVTLIMRRIRDGDLDPGYGEGGHIEGRQERTLTFTSEP
jgi:hypothetical protein